VSSRANGGACKSACGEGRDQLFREKRQYVSAEGSAGNQSSQRYNHRTVHLLHERQVNRSAVRRWSLMVIGVIAVVLGSIGVFVPLLPTTPFLLLAAACFIRSSERLYTWLIQHRWFGSYIRDYYEHRAMTLRAKMVALALLWTVIGYSGMAVASSWWLRLVMALVAVSVTIHLLRLRTLTQDMVQRSGDVGDDVLESSSRLKRRDPEPV